MVYTLTIKSKRIIAMIKKLLLVPALVLSLSTSPIALANIDKNQGEGSCNCPKMQMKKQMMQELNLTDAQKKQFETIKDETKEQMKSVYDQMKDLRNQIKELVTSDKMDQSKLDELVNKKKELYAERVKIKLQAKNKMYNVLNAEQKQKFSAMMEKLEQKKMERMKQMQNNQDSTSDDADDE